MKKYLLIGLIVLSLLVVGCSSDTDVNDFDNSIVIDSSDAEVSIDDSQLNFPEEKPVGADLEPAVIEIYKTLPQPIEITVKVGQSVEWQNIDTISYRVIGDKQQAFKSDPIPPGHKFTYGYLEPGTYTYIVVPGKPGKVIVIE